MRPPVDSPIQTMLLFDSIQLMYEFKHKISCTEFYIDRDAMSFVGVFTTEQVDLAVAEYNAVAKVKRD
jgi:hypothetical protein